MTNGQFPTVRLRRLRRRPWLRGMVRETRLSPDDFVLPLFVHGGGAPIAIPTLPGVVRWPVAGVLEQAQLAAQLGIPAVAVFPAVDPAHKDDQGREAVNPNSLICRTVQALKQQVPDIGVICDVALDPYTAHGHDGVLDAAGDVDNDATVAILVQQAVTLARAGCDVVAPSDMMDGRVGAVRAGLDAAGFGQVAILSYAVKYASAFYGPFRDAVGSRGLLKGSKATYQMDPANAREAGREVLLDVVEGADMVMVKPALPYLDVLAAVRRSVEVPVLAYQVSGEYAAIMFAAQAGAVDGEQAMLESLLSIKRAGADAIFSYAALEVARRIQAKN